MLKFVFGNLYIDGETIKTDCEHWCIVKTFTIIVIHKIQKSKETANTANKRGNSMAEEEKRFSRQLLGKTVVSKTGKRFGEVGDMIFETRSGELIHLILANPTAYTEKLELEKDKEGSILIPFSAVIAIGDFLVIAEEDII